MWWWRRQRRRQWGIGCGSGGDGDSGSNSDGDGDDCDSDHLHKTSGAVPTLNLVLCTWYKASAPIFATRSCKHIIHVITLHYITLHYITLHWNSLQGPVGQAEHIDYQVCKVTVVR